MNSSCGTGRFSLVFLVLLLGCFDRGRTERSVPDPVQASFEQPDKEDGIVLTNVTPRTLVNFQHDDGSSGRRYIVESVASGLATFDYDNDGLIDIYFLNGAPLRGTSVEVLPTNRLYRNLGGFRFIDVTDQAGVGDHGYGLAVAAGDYDGDGNQDLYLSNFGANVLYRNNGDGTFQNVTAAAGTAAADDSKVGAGACFLDMDADGDLDLFVSNYLRFSDDSHVPNYFQGFEIYAGPENYEPLPSILYRNNADGTFSDVSDQLHIQTPWGKGMGVVCSDYDGDRDTDIVVGNDGRPGNFLFNNDGAGTFTDVGAISGIAFNVNGSTVSSMGVACGDYDNDGWDDFFISNYQDQLALLYRNLGNGLFEDVTRHTGAGQGSYNHVTWGCGLIDFDNDGHRDIFYVCGHVLDNVDLFDDSTSYAARPVLLRNAGDGTFLNVSDEAGDGLQLALVGRGTAYDDLDNDGRVDVVILNARRPAVLLRNETPRAGHWIQIRLRGRCHRDGVGARVRVVARDLVQSAEVHSGHGYQSHFGTRLYFGLGNHKRVERIEVDWMGGGRDVIDDVQADRLITIRQGSGALRYEPGHGSPCQ